MKYLNAGETHEGRQAVLGANCANHESFLPLAHISSITALLAGSETRVAGEISR
ncbi:MAG TPA: hypothetical protein VN901_23270 [Candidatus Acidoferrales bacterium]|nr:hypothetical protein [Candidatus Acidoferrales bacterium]